MMSSLSILISSDSIASCASWIALTAFVLDLLWFRVFFLCRTVVACLRALISAAISWNDLGPLNLKQQLGEYRKRMRNGGRRCRHMQEPTPQVTRIL